MIDPTHPAAVTAPAPPNHRRPWRSLLPWWAARYLYGPYGISDWRRGMFGATVDAVPAAVPVDWLLRLLVPVRAWLGLGLVIFIVKCLASPDLSQRVEDAALHGAITMVLGPYGVFVGATIVLLIAGWRRRRDVLRGLTRPVVVALFTILMSVGIFGLQVARVRQFIQGGIDTVTLWTLDLPLPVDVALGMLKLVAVPWLFVFGVCAVYLMHRNGFGHRSHPLLRPFVAVWLAAAVALVEVVSNDHAGLSPLVFWLATLAGPSLTALLGVVEVTWLHRLGLLKPTATT